MSRTVIRVKKPMTGHAIGRTVEPATTILLNGCFETDITLRFMFSLRLEIDGEV